MSATPALADPPTGAGARTAALSTELWLRPDGVGAPPVGGPHLTFGADPARQMTVSWSTPTPVTRPRALVGTLDGGFGHEVPANTRTYRDARSGREVYTHHAELRGLQPDQRHVYAAMHQGTTPESGMFSTAPAGRRPFTFTSFGDQATPSVTWRQNGLAVIPDSLASPAAGDVVAGVEQVAPLFHLVNGDLCYANLSQDRIRTWDDFFANNSRSTRFRPWMPAAGNHENELGNGEIGFSAFQTRFALPGNGESAEFAGLWYAFTAGSVRVVVIQNDDVAYQDAGGSYVRGYSGGRQRAWLERELAASRANRDIDWLVVCMHQAVISSADFNGADRGVRETFAPLFDRYGVDLVVCGHEHHYERSLAVRGVVAGSETLTPRPVSAELRSIDTSKGTVHMVLGGGGTSAPSNRAFYTPAKAKVITGVGAPGPDGRRTSTYVMESAPWLGVRDTEHAYGFAAFQVDPGHGPGDVTSLNVTYYNIAAPGGGISPFERFRLFRRRSDGHG